MRHLQCQIQCAFILNNDLSWHLQWKRKNNKAKQKFAESGRTETIQYEKPNRNILAYRLCAPEVTFTLASNC